MVDDLLELTGREPVGQPRELPVDQRRPRDRPQYRPIAAGEAPVLLDMEIDGRRLGEIRIVRARLGRRIPFGRKVFQQRLQ
ncbi:hypothetical protein C8259_12940 [Nocardia nova]|uniref:Uncharacterized protein n=1 Tax=Nocardia nova TaxID=37330 RepID=A0A2T2Z724_9NOCA|nr:hypothetical protein C8259_12940 [Nocardia nova]